MHFLANLPHEVWVGAAVVGIMALGLAQMIRSLVRKQARLDFALEYRNKFIAYGNSQGTDRETYQWLTLRAQRMQADLGHTGIYASFRPPFEQVVYKDFPIILNMLPRIRQMMDDNKLGTWRRLIPDYLFAVDEALLRYLGPLEEACTTARKELANPILWFRTGVSQILSIPLYLLGLFGLMGSRTIDAIQSTVGFRIIVGISGLIGFVGAVVGLLTDWSEAHAILKSFWGG